MLWATMSNLFRRLGTKAVVRTASCQNTVSFSVSKLKLLSNLVFIGMNSALAPPTAVG